MRLPLLVLASSAAILGSAAPAAFSAPTPPIGVRSHYIEVGDGSTDFYDVGHALGVDAKNGTAPSTSVVILDFGGQTQSSGSWGTLLPGTSTFRSMGNVRVDVEQLGYGFYIGTDTATSKKLFIGMGTNNGLTHGGDAGTTWGNNLDTVNAWFANNGAASFPISQQVHANGANDFEIGFCGASENDCQTKAHNWVDSFDTASTNDVEYNYGDCEGCRTSSSSPASTQTLGHGWTNTDVWYVSYGAASAVATPEIYRNDGVMADQWEQIAEHGHQASCGSCGKILAFVGSLAQHAACSEVGCDSTLDNTADQAWTQLWNSLNNAPAPSYLDQTPPRELNIGWGIHG